MSISPFSARPVPSPEGGGRNRLVVLIATLGIAATLLAYAVSPGVRHAVTHAAHSVRHAVSGMLDHDKGARKKASSSTPAGSHPGGANSSSTPSRVPTGGTAAP